MKKLLKAAGLALGVAVAMSMAEVERAVQKSEAGGVIPTVFEGLNIADTQIIPNDGKTILRVDNAGAEATEVTIVTPGTETGGVGIEDRKVVVANGTKKVIGPFPRSLYNNPKGQLEVKFSKTTSVKLEILSVEST